MANLRANNLFGESGKDPNGSALFDGSGHLTAANSSAFRINYGTTEDYTLEAWIFLKEAPSGNARIAAIYHTSGNQRSYMFYVSSSLELKYNYAGSSSGGAGSVSTLNAGVVPLNEWVHVAVSHDTNTTTLRIYKNGLEKATDNAPHTTYFQNTSGDFVIGQDFPAGFISNLHIARGTCKYKTDFTPYREPIEEISDTTVLCCNSSVDVLSDDKSNTFTQSVDGAVEVSSFIPFDRADSGNIFNGPIKHNTQGYMYFPTGRTEERGRGRGVFFSGNDNQTPASIAIHNTIVFIQIQTMGNTIDFGDSINPRRRRYQAAGSSSTRGVNCGGFSPSLSPSRTDMIESITIATQSNSTDFGNLTEAASDIGTVSNGVRAVSALGVDNSTFTNVINFFTIATTGNAEDFGDTASGAYNNFGCLESPTRGVYIGGNNNTPSPSTHYNRIDFLTIASQGVNTQDFGDLTVATSSPSGTSSNTRGIARHGTSGPTHINSIDFITIASTGNAIDFGDSPYFAGAGGGTGSVSNNIRAVFAGGYGQAPSYTMVNGIEHLTIATTGNSQDFGDISTSVGAANKAGCSDSHGGLS